MTSGNELSPTTRRAVAVSAAAPRSAPPVRFSRRRRVLSVFSVLAVLGFTVAYLGPLGTTVAPAEAAQVDPMSLYANTVADARQYVAAADAAGADLGRDDIVYTVYVKPKPKPTPTPRAGSVASTGWAPPFVTPNPGSAQAIAYDMVTARGWGDDEFACLVALWKKESGWRVNAYNKSSGAYGIPQALPGRKMASAGADWETNPATQISWGLGYIKARYGTPCGAWAKSQRSGWY
ncbi:lytic transglycosylase domain-containing protein [Microbacterium sp. MC2]